jgi:hypothetical protein
MRRQLIYQHEARGAGKASESACWRRWIEMAATVSRSRPGG